MGRDAGGGGAIAGPSPVKAAWTAVWPWLAVAAMLALAKVPALYLPRAESGPLAIFDVTPRSVATRGVDTEVAPTMPRFLRMIEQEAVRWRP